MGWLWGTTATTNKSSSSPAQDPAQSPPAQDAAQPPPAQPPKPAAPKADIDPFFEELMGEVKSMRKADAAAAAAASSKPPAPPSNKVTISPWGSRYAVTSMSGQTPTYPQQPPATTTTPSSSSFDDHDDNPPPPADPDNPTNAPRLSPLAESLLPTTMNCESSFNLAFHCRSLSGQFTALYRYGGVRDCGDKWNDFWFCMRAKGFGDGKVKEDAIRDHFRQKELAKYGPGRPSSEDVWRERKERVKEGEVFVVPLGEVMTWSDAELQKWEMERMERIRKGLKDGDGE